MMIGMRFLVFVCARVIARVLISVLTCTFRVRHVLKLCDHFLNDCDRMRVTDHDRERERETVGERRSVNVCLKTRGKARHRRMFGVHQTQN